VELLGAVVDTITTESYLDRILQVISEMVAETFDSPVCSIMIVDEDKQELSIRAARCSSPEYLQKIPIKIKDSLIGRVVRERALVTVPDRGFREVVQISGTRQAYGSGVSSIGAAHGWI
jgi:signal transduction protein with GAF and PtsI domain